MAPISSPSATRAPDATTAWPIPMPASANRGPRWRTSSTAWTLTAAGDRPSPITIASCCGPAALAGEHAAGSRIELASEIGTTEIVAPVARLAGNLNRLQAEADQSGDETRVIEGGMNGIAGARVIERKVEQCLGRHACAGPAKPDARRRQVPQIAQRTGRRRRRFHIGITRQGPMPRAAGSNSSMRSADRPTRRART